MPRCPRLPTQNPELSLDDLLEGFPARAHNSEDGWIDVAVFYVRHNQPDKAHDIIQQSPLDKIHRLLGLGWLAFHAPDAAAQQTLRANVIAEWEAAQAARRDRGRVLSAHERSIGHIALALSGHPSETDTSHLDVATDLAQHRKSALRLAEAMFALGRPGDAIPKLQKYRLLRSGTGWQTGRLSLYDGAFHRHATQCLVDQQRWDVLAAYGRGLVATKDTMLGALVMRIALRHAPDRHLALGALPPPLLNACFLSVLADTPAHERFRLASLHHQLTDAHAAIARVLFGADAAVDDATSWPLRHRALLAIAQDDPTHFDALVPDIQRDHVARRVVVGGTRILRVQGAAREDWLTRLESLARGLPHPSQQFDILGELGGALCQAGWVQHGRPLLEEAYTGAEAQGGSQRSDALARVAAYAFQGGQLPIALKVLRRCRTASVREGLVPWLVDTYTRQGDLGGVQLLLDYLPAGSPRGQGDALAAALRATDNYRGYWQTPPLITQAVG